MSEDDFRVVATMTQHGGSFVCALADAFRRADRENFIKLKTTFSEYWEKYDQMSKSKKGGQV